MGASSSHLQAGTIHRYQVNTKYYGPVVKQGKEAKKAKRVREARYILQTGNQKLTNIMNLLTLAQQSMQVGGEQGFGTAITTMVKISEKLATVKKYAKKVPQLQAGLGFAQSQLNTLNNRLQQMNLQSDALSDMLALLRV